MKKVNNKIYYPHLLDLRKHNPKQGSILLKTVKIEYTSNIASHDDVKHIINKDNEYKRAQHSNHK